MLIGILSCDGARANVLHWVGFVRWLAALLPLQKGWHFVYRFGVSFNAALSSNRVAHNESLCDLSPLYCAYFP
ncbi:MAG: hypothetical protein LC109_10510, partial [Bacteroidia bacterium]|nr:hypothetical protein [Bacteroidia bacterium]